MLIVKLDNLPTSDLQPLLEESQLAGLKFLGWLVDDYVSGKNRFDQSGEALFGVYRENQLIAIGGLNRDPYALANDVGRVRRVYVLAEYRQQGVGRQLVQQIVTEARSQFRLLTLRTHDEIASQFYSTLGFQTEPAIEGATHHLVLAD